MKKKNAIGACVLAAAIVLAVPLGVHTSLTETAGRCGKHLLLRQCRVRYL